MKILFAILILAIAVLLAWNVYEHHTQGKLQCSWCQEIIWEEGTQIRKWWLHDRCWSNAALEYGWYKESSTEVIDKICEELERRNENK